MMIGDAVRYRSISGEIYDGVLTSLPRPDGTAGVDVSGPGWPQPFSLTRVQWSEQESPERYTAWPRGKGDAA